jgi:hypothetical protein
LIEEVVMLDRQKIEAILIRRFPGATSGQVAAAANGIMGLGDEWEEVPEPECTGFCHLVREIDEGSEVRLFRRRVA